MSTDTLTPRDPWLVLRPVLETVLAGSTFSAATWHDEAVLAGLRSGQIVAAQKHAVTAGWLEPIGCELDGTFSPNMVRAQHEKADGRWVAAYRRTSLYAPTVERAEVPGQLDLLEVS